VGKDAIDGENGLRDKMTKKKMIGLRFRSRSEHVLDAKGCLNIPNWFREDLSSLGIL
jgi:hypothetical protein